MSARAVKRYGRRCQTCGLRKPTTRTRTVEQYPTGKVFEPKAGGIYIVAKTTAMVCDGCADESVQ